MKKNKKPAGIVYTVTHKQTGYTYVGVTTKSLKERKRDHLQKAHKGTGHYFQEAIGTYGPDAFKWQQVDTAQNLDELARKEREYIKELNAVKKGFNSNSGGGLRKTVYQYSIDSGVLVNQFDSLDVAAMAVKADKRSISRACLNVNNTFGGFYWSYTLSEHFEPSADKRRKEVEQLDRQGNVLAKYRSVAEASRQTGLSKSPIAKTCRGEQDLAGGFYWRYVKNCKISKSERYEIR